MKIHNFIIQSEFLDDKIIIQDKEQIKQIIKVLRLKIDDFLNIFNGKGGNAECQIKNISKNKIECVVLKRNFESEPKIKVFLFLSILKKENFELALQKAIECGVWSITPIKTQRTIKTNLNYERLNKIAKEASEQSGRAYLPKINKINFFEEEVLNTKNFDKKIIFDISGFKIDKDDRKIKNICIFIGPEGGFTKKELEKAKEHNFNITSLGNLTLRAETAAIVGTYLFVN